MIKLSGITHCYTKTPSYFCSRFYYISLYDNI
nr:MAG TPA: hypothetical protein [Caudoviricetes sp.]